MNSHGLLAKGMKWKMQESISVCHNYIDKEGILRKGAISAREGEKVVIPINMRDGILLGIGKGNPDWNYDGDSGSSDDWGRAGETCGLSGNRNQ